jgi:HlyD family secretion protein
MNDKFKILFARIIPFLPFLIPLGVMVFLTVKFLLPSLKDPKSNMYSSGIGYPSTQRMLHKPIEVNIVTVSRHKLPQEYIAAAGVSTPNDDIKVAAKTSVPTLVKKIFVDEGVFVKKGDRLVQLDPTSYLLAYQGAQNNVKVAQEQLQFLKDSLYGKIVQLRSDLKYYEKVYKNQALNRQNLSSLIQKKRYDNLKQLKSILDVQEKLFSSSQLLDKEGGISKNAYYKAKLDYETAKLNLEDAQTGDLGQENTKIILNNNYSSSKRDFRNAQINLAIALNTLDNQLKVAQLNVVTQKVALRVAKDNLQKTLVVAPQDGLISKVNVDPGEVYTSGTFLVNLTNDNIFRAYIDQVHINEIKVGYRAIVHLVSYPGRIFSGKVTLINPTIISTSAASSGAQGINNQYTFYAQIALEGIKMTPGLQGYAEFTKHQSQQSSLPIIIPESAVTHLSSGEGLVMLDINGIAVLRKVRLGKAIDNQRPVLAGLKEGEIIVLTPHGLVPGDTVKAVVTKKNSG